MAVTGTRPPGFAPVLAVVLAVSGCGTDSAPARDASAGDGPLGLRTSRVFLDAGGRPDFVLTDDHGEPYDFRAETRGHLTLLFFGYTHCPDVCPVHMSNIAEVRRDLGIERARDMRVVFVTVDPERDTPDRLTDWLAGFDPSFVGLYGDPAAVDSIQLEIGLPPAVVPEEHSDAYEVGHASAVVAFTARDEARVMFPFGTRQADLLHDLRILADLGREGGRP